MPSASFRSSVVWLEEWGAVIYAGREKRRPLNFHGALKVQRRPPFPPPHMRGEERGGERLFCPFLDLLLLYFDEPISLWDFGTKGIRDVFGVVTEGRSPRRTHLTQFLKPECFKDTFLKKSSLRGHGQTGPTEHNLVPSSDKRYENPKRA